MILVDTSVWIDHLHRRDARLAELLESDQVAVHEGIIDELALGSIRARDVVIELLSSLTRAPSITHDELRGFVDREKLWGRGLSVIDVQLLASARLAGMTLWTRDRRLRTAAAALDISVIDEDQCE